ncbi:MAG: DUF3592 domain-containing protein [Firmicutes bacterium]|nr:DUF3592 domain-containing protein [Bacillota bacterium]
MREKIHVGKEAIIIGIIVALLGCLLLYFALDSQTKFKKFRESAETVQALVTKTETRTVTRRSSKGRRRTSHKYDVYIEYTVEGQMYESVLRDYGKYKSSGEHVSVYYDPENPRDVRTEKHYEPAILVGGGILLIGLLIFVSGARKYRKARNLVDLGKYIQTYDWFVENANVRVNKVMYKRVVCKYYDDRGGEYTFKSGAMHPNKIPFAQGSPIKVYVDIELDPKSYYVSMEPTV